MNSFDLAVIGAGPGGYVAAIRAAQLGMKVALIEKSAALGGTCLNVGCVPSKALLESSEMVSVARHKLGAHGIRVGEVTFDLVAMMARKDRIVKELTDGLAMLMKKNKVTVLQGVGSLTGAGKAVVASGERETEIEAKSIVLATGSGPASLPFMPFDGERVVSSTEALCFDSVPASLAVIGAGAVGLEMGSVWARLGSKVTILEMLPQIVPFADAFMARLLQKSLAAQGLDICLKVQVGGAEVKNDGVTISFMNERGEAEQLRCDKVLVAVGRKPFTEGLGLETVGIQTDKNGRIPVNERFQTNAPNVYAIGDLIAGPMLAHKAEDEGVAVAEIAAGKLGHVNYEAIPNIVYTWPELAQVGVTEEEAKAKGLSYKVGRYFFKPNARAKTLEEEDGMVKIIADAKTDRLLGVHIVGARASDMIAEAAVAFEFRASSEDLARASHAHPTLSEIIREAALAVDKRAIHG